MGEQPLPKSSTGLDPKVAGLLCYLGVFITGIIFFIIEKESRYVKFHAMQSIVVFGALTVLSFIPLVGFIVYFVQLVAWIALMVLAYQGNWTKVPFAGDIAEKQSASF
ncbi:hypothetical protein G4V62_06710 [Bacillaceae bacterium SIJ1]|uniref:DUF4870 domain-containing protein n=1 Tax=Litoribacterium kuwaitense TaxID=1398745 RepID=UPI0013ED6BD4|nr:hypothetical protein [Litoribacterium kuwaitense]NGP44657.1 hypothetical protein [Litoribacterium kuwaitense]